MEARPLNTNDVFWLAGIIRECREDVQEILKVEGPKLMKLGQGQAFQQEEALAFGTQLLFALLAQADSGIKPWLADMAGMAVDEFGKLPIRAFRDLIRSILTQEDWPDFFGELVGATR